MIENVTAGRPPATLVAERYRLLALLGRGAMGDVYRAADLRLGQDVALKFLAPVYCHDRGARARFLEEVRLARQVSHPNVCRVHDIGESAGRLFFSMELVEGEDLATRLARGPLPGEQAGRVCLRICRGLGAIHAQGLLHRDLKPANVMLDQRGEVRLTDFGWAVPAGPAATGEGVPAGTLAYHAPELVLGEPASMRSDLYALGLLIHEVFTARRPHPSHALLELARAHGDPATPVPDVEPRLDPALDPVVARVVRWCLATLPRDRPASAEAVAAALRPENEEQPGIFLAALVACDPDPGSAPATRELLAQHGGREVVTAGGKVWLFKRSWAAVCCVLAWRRSGVEAALARVGVHLDEIALERHGRGALRAVGPEVVLARRLAAIARPGQTLLGPHAFELARHHSVGENTPGAAVRWLSHGRFQLAGEDAAIEVFEVGQEGAAPFLAPDCGELARPLAEETIAGWRPAPGAEIPQRPGWRIERKLGSGGFGDVWLARSHAGGERRVLKFCYDAARLRTLRREITIFRLLREELGERSDITRVIDWSFEEAPFFIESEYTSAGSLPEWAAEQGGLAQVPLAQRLEIVAQVASALAAAHSVGVLHKDVKPGNVLIAAGDAGSVHAQLCDFGLGVITDRRRLAALGITALGLSASTTTERPSSEGTAGYLAPELLEGQPPTLRSDVYALGVLLYQMVLGDLRRVLASGWRREIGDELLCEDVAAAVDGVPGLRLGDAAQLAERLRTLDVRRARRAAERRAEQRAERARRLRRVMSVALVALGIFAAVVSALALRVAREARRAERERQAAQQVADFLTGMFELTDPFETAPGPPRERTARDVLDAGAHRLATELQDQPEARARLINTTGRVYQHLGLYDAAVEQFEQALALRRATLGGDAPAVAESLHDLGWVEHLRDHQERAEALLRQTLELRRASLGEEHLYVANTLHDLAWVLEAKGELDAAVAMAREALGIKRRVGGDDRAVAASLNLLAFLYLAKGEPAAAEPYAREALAITRRLWGEHPDVAESLNGLARVLLAKGEPDAAEPFAREALAMRRKLLGAQHPAVAQSLHDLAAVLMAKGDDAQAEVLLRDSLALYRQRFGDGHAGVAMCLRSLEQLEALRRAQAASELNR